jgi:hypothetical protein
LTNYLQTIVKLLFFQIHKDALERLLKQKLKFWKINDFDGTIQEKCTKITYFGKMIIRCAYFSVLPGTFFFDMQPFTTGSLPSRCYVPEGWFTGLIVLFWYVSCLSTTSMPMADGLFFSFAVSLIVQFKLLRHKFKNMKLLKNQSEVKVWNELKQLVDHHNFLLRYKITKFLFFILTTLLVIAKISTQLIKDCFLGYFS